MLAMVAQQRHHCPVFAIDFLMIQIHEKSNDHAISTIAFTRCVICIPLRLTITLINDTVKIQFIKFDFQ